MYPSISQENYCLAMSSIKLVGLQKDNFQNSFESCWSQFIDRFLQCTFLGATYLLQLGNYIIITLLIIFWHCMYHDSLINLWHRRYVLSLINFRHNFMISVMILDYNGVSSCIVWIMYHDPSESHSIVFASWSTLCYTPILILNNLSHRLQLFLIKPFINAIVIRSYLVT